MCRNLEEKKINRKSHWLECIEKLVENQMSTINECILVDSSYFKY